MTTALDIVTRALRGLAVLDATETPSAEDGANALDHLNDMMFEWAASGVNLNHSALTLASTFIFMVPPRVCDADVIEAASNRGSWDANANSPTLAGATGTKGYYYRVTTAGSTTLDDVTSWSADDYALYTGTEWVKALNSRRFDGGIAALLAVRMAPDYGIEPSAPLVARAANAWSAIQAAFVRAPKSAYDRALTDTPSRRTYVADIETA